jgi:DNA-binding transcriptional ArsR family regulator
MFEGLLSKGMFRDIASRRSVQLTDPRALRALAHPVRLELVGLLRREGPLTATQAAAHVGESPSSCSFHLRQLAKYGLVEEALPAPGRQRPWQATAVVTSWPNVTRDPELAAAADLLNAVVVERLFEHVLRWIDARAGDADEWQHAAGFGDRMLYLTSGELAGLGREIQALFERHADRSASAGSRPEGSRRVMAMYFAFPFHEDG